MSPPSHYVEETENLLPTLLTSTHAPRTLLDDCTRNVPAQSAQNVGWPLACHIRCVDMGPTVIAIPRSWLAAKVGP